jgi:glycosyltransferase involved in cell wall biosynthesis
MPGDAPEVLVISKPVAPPWDDSGKVIARDQAACGERFRYRVLSTPGTPAPGPNAVAEPLYRDTGRYAAGPRQNARVFLRGLRRGGAALFHYFFAPNPLSSAAGRVQRLAARVPTVQTCCSAPAAFDRAGRLLFADLAIVLSADTRRRFEDAGIDPARLRLVRPGIRPLPRPDDGARRTARRACGLPEGGPLVVFPGDYEFSSAAATVARAAPELLGHRPDAILVFACRIKREASRAIRDGLRGELERAGLHGRVRFLERVDDMPAFVGAADAVILPSESLHAKMDAPLVLLEAMSQGVPLVLAAAPPLDELIATGAALPVRPGDPAALAAAVARILDSPETARALGEAGRLAIRETYNARTMARGVEDVYDELLAKRRAGRR